MPRLFLVEPPTTARTTSSRRKRFSSPSRRRTTLSVAAQNLSVTASYDETLAASALTTRPDSHKHREKMMIQKSNNSVINDDDIEEDFEFHPNKNTKHENTNHYSVKDVGTGDNYNTSSGGTLRSKKDKVVSLVQMTASKSLPSSLSTNVSHLTTFSSHVGNGKNTKRKRIKRIQEKNDDTSDWTFEKSHYNFSEEEGLYDTDCDDEKKKDGIEDQPYKNAINELHHAPTFGREKSSSFNSNNCYPCDGCEHHSSSYHNGLVVLPNRAIAIDNRALPTMVGDAMIRNSFLSPLVCFLKSALKRGILKAALSSIKQNGESSTVKGQVSHGETVMASFTSHNNAGNDSRRTSNGVKARAAFLLEGMYGCGMNVLSKERKGEMNNWFLDFVQPVNHSLGNCGSVELFKSSITGIDSNITFSNHHAISDPMPLNADESGVRQSGMDGFNPWENWNYFGDLVEAIEKKIKSNACPYSLSLFTTDATLFADTNATAHVAGFKCFRNRVSKLLQSKVSVINIIIVETSRVLQTMNAIKGHDFMSRIVGIDQNSSTCSFPNRLQVTKCINDIHTENTRFSEGCSEITSVTGPTNIMLQLMDGSFVEFQTLSQIWLKESFHQSFPSGGSHKSSRSQFDAKIRFELPETIDGTMCHISLDLEYTILPYCLDSSATKNLVTEMNTITSLTPSSVEVVQALPIQSIDSSLIYGVPMFARAGSENGTCHEDHMKILVRELWRYLSNNNLALVLRVCSDSEYGDSVTDPRAIVKIGKCYDERLFLLTSQQAVQKQKFPSDNVSCVKSTIPLEVVPDEERRGEEPCHGVLYNYATKNHLLHFGREDTTYQRGKDNANLSIVNECSDYIERSMDMLIKTGLNPFLLGDSFCS